jgi:hypothetical protein
MQTSAPARGRAVIQHWPVRRGAYALLRRSAKTRAVAGRAFAASAFDSPWPARNARCSTAACDARNSSANLAAFSAGTIRSCAPDMMSTGLAVRSPCGPKGKQIVFVTAGAVQKEERCRSLPCARLEAGHQRRRRHHAKTSIGGNAASISLLRASRKPGSFSEVPSASTGSSTAKPGMSVAISNRTPPGSRK